jgi:hypothetical protein
MFDIGEKVICVDASKQAHTIDELNKDVPNWVKQGERYTIRGFTDNNGIVEAVWLEEIVNPLKFFKLINRLQEPAFAIWRFRKLRPDEVKEEVNIDELVILN